MLRKKGSKITSSLNMAAHCDFIAGVTAGACNMFISHPLDTIKTNMQNENMRFFQAAKILFKIEGVSKMISCLSQH